MYILLCRFAWVSLFRTLPSPCDVFFLFHIDSFKSTDEWVCLASGFFILSKGFSFFIYFQKKSSSFPPQKIDKYLYFRKHIFGKLSVECYHCRSRTTADVILKCRIKLDIFIYLYFIYSCIFRIEIYSFSNRRYRGDTRIWMNEITDDNLKHVVYAVFISR